MFAAAPVHASYPSSWKRKPSWPTLRLVDGQSEELLVVGDPWTIEIPPKGRECVSPVRHFVNVVLKRHLTDSSVPAAFVWEISDLVFRNITFDPTIMWLRITRHGSGRRNTQYDVEAFARATDNERELACSKRQYDLELVSIETRARYVNKRRNMR